MTALAEQKLVTKTLVRQESAVAPIVNNFPVASEESLKEIETKIMPENRAVYITTIRRLFQQSVTRNLKNIFTDEITLSQNLGGTHGKKRLKKYDKFCSALLDLISHLPKVEDAENHLRKAIRLQKKQYFKNVSSSKATPLP